jgi:tetratricopeptide (TPR) repeat protein
MKITDNFTTTIATNPLLSLLAFLALILSAFSPPNLYGQTENDLASLLKAGEQLTQEGKLQEAFGKFDQAFRLAPDSPEVNFKLGLAARSLHDYETAVMAFERVLITDPGLVQAKIEMAKSFYNLGSFETAKQYFQEVLESDIPAETRENIISFMQGMP